MDLLSKIKSVFGHAILSKTSYDSSLAEVECIEGSHSDVKVYQEYGIASRPLKGCRVFMAFLGGDRGHGVCIGSRGKKLPSIEEGEVAVYSDFGSKILLKKDGSISLFPSTGKRVRVESDLDVAGNLNSSGEVTAKAVDVPEVGMAPEAGFHLSTHVHGSGIGPTAGTTPVS